MMRLILPFRQVLIASALLVGAVGSAGTASPIMVSFHGTLNSDAATTIDGWFQYDKGKKVDTKLGRPVNGQFTFTGQTTYTHYLNYSTTKNGLNGTDLLPATDGDTFVILTNTDTATPKKKFQVTVTDNGNTYVVIMNTPDGLSQTALPDSGEFPVLTPLGSGISTSPLPSGYGTLTKTPVGGGTPLVYTIYVTSCVPPNATLSLTASESTRNIDKTDDTITLNNFYINAELLPILRSFLNHSDHGGLMPGKRDPAPKPAKTKPAKK